MPRINDTFVLDPLGTLPEAYAARVALRVYVAVLEARTRWDAHPFDGSAIVQWVDDESWT